MPHSVSTFQYCHLKQLPFLLLSKPLSRTEKIGSTLLLKSFVPPITPSGFLLPSLLLARPSSTSYLEVCYSSLSPYAILGFGFRILHKNSLSLEDLGRDF